MKIILGSDHAGFLLKEDLKVFLEELGHQVVDKGAFRYNAEDDYPDFIIPAVQEIHDHIQKQGGGYVPADDNSPRAIVLGASGQGEGMAANRFPGIRAVVFNGQYDPDDGRELPHEITLARTHNDSNVLSLGAAFLNEQEAREAVRYWLETPFSDEERHLRRLQKIEEAKIPRN